MITRFVIFGASGDLTMRLLLPALAELRAESALPEDLQIVGVGLDDWSSEHYRSMMSDSLAEHAGKVAAEVRAGVIDHLFYEQADVTDAERVRQIVAGDEPLVAYLALPPGMFLPTLEALAAADMAQGSVIAIEKPFGRSLQEARELNRLLRTRLSDTQVFRNDHFLYQQMIQNILGLRFANILLEPLWSRDYIERVEIVWDETLTLEDRAGYYDGAGALRDMIQNHLLQVLCFIAMEPPPSLEARDLRDARVAVLRAIPTMSRDQVIVRSVRGRYGAGTIDGREVPAYIDEEGVNAARCTETFAQVILTVDNWRWAGTPFTLRSGKAMASRRSEVVVVFRNVPHPVFAGSEGCTPNQLRLSLAPPAIHVGLNINAEGELFGLVRAGLDAKLPVEIRSPYAGLVLNAIQGDVTLAVRGDETEEAWRIVEPVLDAWAEDAVPLETYPAGGSPPLHR